MNVYSGELAFQSSKTIKGDSVGFDKLPVIHNWSFFNNNKIIGTCDCWIYILDISTNEITLFDRNEYLSDNDIGYLNSSFKIAESEQNLFLIGYEKMKYDIVDFKRASFIIALNKATLKIDWKCIAENLDSEGPRLFGNNIFQRNTQNQLLIFGKASGTNNK